jgi:hypothetical protein
MLEVLLSLSRHDEQTSVHSRSAKSDRAIFLFETKEAFTSQTDGGDLLVHFRLGVSMQADKLALPSDDYRFAAERRIIALLHRSVKRVDIDMDDFSHSCPATILFPTETTHAVLPHSVAASTTGGNLH